MGFLTGKTAIITGAGYAVLSDGRCGSIGYGIATAYAKEGANLVLTGRNVAKLEKAKEERERLYGIKVLALSADISAGSDNEAIAKGVAEKAIEEFGRIDVLINNAQASASGVAIQDHTTEQFDLAMYSGLYATFYYMKACYPYLKETKGSIINFASGAGLFGNYGQCSYAAAKESIPISSVLLLGLLSLKTSGMLIPKPSRQTSRCLLQVITAMPSLKSAASAFSLHPPTSSISTARPSPSRAEWVFVLNRRIIKSTLRCAFLLL